MKTYNDADYYTDSSCVGFEVILFIIICPPIAIYWLFKWLFKWDD